MKLALALILLLLPCAALAQAPTQSLFFSPQEAERAEALAAQKAHKTDDDITLGAILFYGPGDWTLWIKGEKWTPATERDDMRILSVTLDSVDLEWKDEDGQWQQVLLHPNQRIARPIIY